MSEDTELNPVKTYLVREFYRLQDAAVAACRDDRLAHYCTEKEKADYLTHEIEKESASID